MAAFYHLGFDILQKVAKGEASVKILSFEEISVGQTAGLELAVTAELVDAFARLTGDVNPLHTSEEFARSRGYGARVSHGLLVASFFSAVAGTMLPGRDCLLQSARFDFKKPVLVGTRLTLEARVLQKVEALRTLVLEITARDSSGEIMVGGRIQAGVAA
jgi:3-hydroxybutyryl-CoA dehydratase